MSLSLGKLFNRCYCSRVPFLNGFYDIGVYFDTKSHFFLFDIKPIATMVNNCGVNVRMFKNIEAAKFTQLFLDLHSYRSDNLDIKNQIKTIKENSCDAINMILIESIILGNHRISSDKTIKDTMNIYGYGFSNYPNEYLFMVAERCFICRQTNRKIVRTGALQIASTDSSDFIESIFLSEIGKLKPPIIETKNQPSVDLTNKPPVMLLD